MAEQSKKKTELSPIWKKAVSVICESCVHMASERIDALIVIENNDSLEEYINFEKNSFNADISLQCLGSIFFRNSEFNTGAAIIRNGKICAAGVHYPISSDSDPKFSPFQQTALSIASSTDAIAIVVSGEKGVIFSYNAPDDENGGEIRGVKRSGDELRQLLNEKIMQKPEAKPDIKNKTGFLNGLVAKLMKKDSALKIISIIAAVIVWGAVSINVYPTLDKVLYNVPVEIPLEGSYAQSNQLEITSSSQPTVNVTVTGKRSQIGNLKAEDLKAVVDVSTVMMPREYSLSMTIDSDLNTEFDVVSISPSTINVTFDKIISKEFDVSPQLENLRTAAGYMSGDPIVTPSAVTVTGPQDIINSITKVCAKTVCDKELDSTYEFNTSELVLYNNNAIISTDNKMMSYDKNSFAIQIPVYVRQTLPLEVNIINAPDNFDLDYFRSQLEFSLNELTIAAPNDKIRELTSLNIGTINMREVGIGSVFEFRTDNFLPEGYENLSQTDTITVTCPSEGLAKKTIAIMGKNIQFINRPAQFEFTPVASGMTLFLVGDEEQIDELSSADIAAQINLIDFDMQEGDHKMPVDFIISYYDKVWFFGEDGVAAPKIYVTAEYIPPEEDEEE